MNYQSKLSNNVMVVVQALLNLLTVCVANLKNIFGNLSWGLLFWGHAFEIKKFGFIYFLVKTCFHRFFPK